jgi:CO/xanthine dehydrogenase Mo-binding subunit
MPVRSTCRVCAAPTTAAPAAEIRGLFGDAALVELTADAVDGPRGRIRLMELAGMTEPRLRGTGATDGSPRSIAFNVQGFDVAVNVNTGELRILASVHAADAGVVLNPEQCRGQIEGGVAQGIGTALYEEMVLDDDGSVVTQTLRRYHLPQMADIPHTRVFFADTYDQIGPLGAKSMSESPYNPVAPALANAIRDAVGVRLTELPLSRDRIWRATTRLRRMESLLA